MIELRWVAIEIDWRDQHSLQYRYRFPLLSQMVSAYPPEDWGWSEWMNVPAYREIAEVRQ